MLADPVARHQTERRPRAGEEWLPVTQHDGVKAEAAFVNQTEIGQAPSQARPGNVDLPHELHLEFPDHRLDVVRNKRWGRPTSAIAR